jgi:hypothetical protein
MNVWETGSFINIFIYIFTSISDYRRGLIGE